jgi:hypothetical protein
MELEQSARQLVGAGLGDGVDLPADRAAELRAVGIGFHAELANVSIPSAVPGGAARRAVREVVEQGAVQQIDVGARDPAR